MQADDLLQSFFLRLIEGNYHILKLWQRGTSLPIYLARVIRNFLIDSHRTKRSQQKMKDALEGLARIDTPLVEKNSAAGMDGLHHILGTSSGAPLRAEEITPGIELRELKRLGLEAWADLEVRDRFLTCGKFHRELSNESMAERLMLTEGALRTALSRAQGRLLAGLKMRAPEYFPT
jgi:RNA polymerase sigma factor (sigma-70 family)